MSLFDAQDITISHRRDGQPLRLIEHACLTLEAGSIYDLTGPSGCGKSTLLRGLARLIDLDSGTMLLEGTPHTSFSPVQWRVQVCLVPQKPSLVPGTVQDNLLLPWSLKVRSNQTAPHEAALRQMLDQAALEDVELDRDVSQLSGGQAARIALVRAFLTDARVLLLDEVDAALDEASSHAVSLLTRQVVGQDRACLRIRHRQPDGLARGVFAIAEGALTHSTLRQAI